MNLIAFIYKNLYKFDLNQNTMKNKTLFILLFLFVSIAGCKKEDTDKILGSLSTSKSSYEAAANGSWIEITNAEYSSLAASLSNVTRSGTSETDYITATTGAILTNTGSFTIAQNDGNTMPSGSYLFAVKINIGGGTNTSSKVKISNTSASAGFSDLGTVLPSHTTGEHFFLLKGNATATTSIGYLGYYKPSGAAIYRNSVAGKGSYQFENNDSNTLSQAFTGIVFLYQGLSTTTKQW